MFCPNCGAKNSTEQNFCRACGLQLEDISNALLVQVPSAGSDKPAGRTAALGKVGNYGLASVVTIASATVVYLIITWFMLTGVTISGAFFLLLPCFIWVIAIAYIFYKRSLRNKHKLLPRSPLTPMVDEHTLPLSNGNFTPPTITEGTTRRLE